MTTLRYDELAGAVGVELGTSRWYEFDQQRISTFGDVTDDRQWIHTDPEVAASGPYGATIAHGYLTLSMVSAIILELLVVEGVATYVNYGLDRVRFPSPVLVDSRVRGTVTITGAEQLEGVMQLSIRVVISAAGAPKPACIADVVARLTPER